ncbi:hypothetical protein LINGRAHAP2_LOCUS19302 [Linum grandiflorum]
MYEDEPIDCNIDCRRCGCGENIVLLTSWTEDNPGRRFWKCRSRHKTNTRGLRHYFEWHDPPVEKQSKQVINGLLRRLNKLEGEKRDEVDSATSCSRTSRLCPVDISTNRMNDELILKYEMLVRWIKVMFVLCIFMLGFGLGKFM